MDVSEILASLDEEIAKLQRAKDTLLSLQSPSGSPNQLRDAEKSQDGRKTQPRMKRTITPGERARIVAAQKARWTKHEKISVADNEPVSA